MDLLGPIVGGEPRCVAVCIAHGFPQSRGLGRLDARSAHLLDEQAAEEKGLVANHLGVEPKPRTARQQPVGGVPRQALASPGPLSPVSASAHREDRPM